MIDRTTNPVSNTIRTRLNHGRERASSEASVEEENWVEPSTESREACPGRASRDPEDPNQHHD